MISMRNSTVQLLAAFIPLEMLLNLTNETEVWHTFPWLVNTNLYINNSSQM